MSTSIDRASYVIMSPIFLAPILDRLTYIELSRSRRVCKKWNEIISSHPIYDFVRKFQSELSPFYYFISKDLYEEKSNVLCVGKLQKDEKGANHFLISEIHSNSSVCQISEIKPDTDFVIYRKFDLKKAGIIPKNGTCTTSYIPITSLVLEIRNPKLLKDGGFVLRDAVRKINTLIHYKKLDRKA